MLSKLLEEVYIVKMKPKIGYVFCVDSPGELLCAFVLVELGSNDAQ